jgi:hypothetical protein
MPLVGQRALAIDLATMTDLDDVDRASLIID